MSTTTLPEDHARVTRVAVHDRTGWLGRGLYYDLLALAVNLLAAVAIGVDLYAAGYARATTAIAPDPSFAPLARLGLELVVFIGSFAWLAARVVRASYQEIPQAR